MTDFHKSVRHCLLKTLFCIFAFLPTQGFSLPVIHGVTAPDTIIGRYEKFEATVSLTAVYTNPYDYDQVVLSAMFTSPSGVDFRADGFFIQEYTLNESTGNLTQTGAGEFRLRFSPTEVGTWTYTTHLQDATGSTFFLQKQFQCIPTKQEKNKGFVRRGNTNYLQFDDGTPYIPIGENIAWQNSNAYNDYNTWIGQLAENDGNFFRLWHAHWGLGIEWRAGQSNFTGLRRYKQTSCKYQDWLFDHCADLGVYVLLCLQHHGQVSSQVNPNWSESPYNTVNGGPCQNTWDFFTNTAAKAHTENRLRYVVARWGYARSVMAWELFNEVDWTDEFATRRGDVAQWHVEMAAYLKSVDPYGRLVTTSYARDVYDDELWQSPEMDFTQTHFYINSGHLERALTSGIHRYLDEFEKPTLTGEFGLGGSENLSQADPDGVYLHNSMWATLYGGGLGAAMSWWWDNYIHPRGLYSHFGPLAAVASKVDFIKRDLKPVAAHVTGVPGDLSLTPVLGWGDLADGMLTIDATGMVLPENARLSAFLYGSQWNTQYRRPPTFSLTYVTAGKFTVVTGSESGTDPSISISLDGNTLLNQVAIVNTSYTINVPAGAHQIKVDNTGTDWITIASYTFENAGSRIDPYVLKSAADNYLAGWILNTDYNHISLAADGIPDPAEGGTLIVDGFENGTYTADWYNCTDGQLVSTTQVVVSQSQLRMALPDVAWDLAFILAPEGGVSTKEIVSSLSYSSYPNPIAPGEVLTLKSDDLKDGEADLYLLDVLGKIICGQSGSGGKVIQLHIPEHLASGNYYLRLSMDDVQSVVPIVVMQK